MRERSGVLEQATGQRTGLGRLAGALDRAARSVGAVLVARGRDLRRNLHPVDRPPTTSRRHEDEAGRVHDAFVAATFATMGRLAHSADGSGDAHGATARAIMGRLALSAARRAIAADQFTRGQSPTFPLEQVVERFADECRRRRDLTRRFIALQVEFTSATGPMRPEERAILSGLCRRMGITATELATMEAAAGGTRAMACPPSPGASTLAEAHAVLGVGPEADEATVKRAYRRLLSRHHPDRLHARGRPDESVLQATRKTQEIKAAYERARTARPRRPPTP